MARGSGRAAVTRASRPRRWRCEDDSVGLDELAADPPERLALVLGTEGDGLSRRTIAAVDVTVRIPMAGGVDSLNVAAAGAVAAWALRVPRPH